MLGIGAVGSFVGRMFGTEKAAASMIDGLKSGLDKLVYTSEEKAEDNAKDISEARSMFIGWMKATSGQNLARRILAFLVAGVWALFYLTKAVLSLAAIWVEDAIKSGKLVESSDIMSANADQMNGAMMLILGFYFAAPHMKDIVGAAMAKFSGKG